MFLDPVDRSLHYGHTKGSDAGLNFGSAIFVPFPSFVVSQPLPTRNEDRLQTIIKNLDEHHAQVRGNIIALATEHSKALASNPLDAPMADAQDISYLISSLQTPFKGDSKDDPALRPGQKVPRPPNASTRGQRDGNAGETPEYIKLTHRTLKELEEYDKRAAKTRAFYEYELRKMGASVSPVEQAPNLRGGAQDDHEHSRGPSAEPMEGVIKSLDPRLRRLSIPRPTVGVQVAEVGPVEGGTGARIGTTEMSHGMYQPARDPRLSRL